MIELKRGEREAFQMFIFFFFFFACASHVVSATHKLFFTCCPPTYTHNTPSTGRDKHKHKQTQQGVHVATLLGLTMIPPEETCCLYPGHSALDTMWPAFLNNGTVFLPLTLRNCDSSFWLRAQSSASYLQVKLSHSAQKIKKNKPI